MSIYDELGVRPVINANATLTKLGGSVMPPEVIAAMEDAARFHVDLEELHDRVGERLAELTGNEAAMVATGAAAGIVLAVAACVSGGDRELARHLPHTEALDKNEVIMFTSHRNGYDFAVRQTGVKVIEIGSETYTDPAELEAGAFFYGGEIERQNVSNGPDIIKAAGCAILPVTGSCLGH